MRRMLAAGCRPLAVAALVGAGCLAGTAPAEAVQRREALGVRVEVVAPCTVSGTGQVACVGSSPAAATSSGATATPSRADNTSPARVVVEPNPDGRGGWVTVIY